MLNQRDLTRPAVARNGRIAPVLVPLMAALLLAATPALAQSTDGAQALRAPSPLKIDGDLGDWAFAKDSAITLDSQAQLTPGADSPDTWSGPADLSATIYVAYDDTNLYLAYDVRDDKVVQQFSGDQIYNGDGPELYLDFTPDGQAAAYDNNVWQFGFTPGTDAAAPAWVLYQQVQGRSIDPSAVKVAAQRTANGYTMEVAIALSALGQTLQPGHVIHFDVAVNDVDNTSATATENQIILSRAADGWQNPSVFVPLTIR
ncbi:MAG: hypothetical protein IMX01_01455 [Limnochordaceae bacterium]|nr:hypothetical protein [Limnochordaceae bacterium]